MSDNYHRDAAVITKSDTVDLPAPTHAIYVGGAGTMKVRMQGVSTANNDVTFFGIPAGTTLNIRAIRVFSANTSATNMIALY